jgi:alkylation response protein AidB-like acyl-CoA dehydrogenase
MDFELPSETRLLRDMVRRFVEEELLPLEGGALAREARGEPLTPPRVELERLYAKAKNLGLVGLDVPKELGGAEIGAIAKIVITEEIARSIIPFAFPPDAPNLHMMLRTANEDQRQRYVLPYARGETVSAIAISEPDAGSDPSRMKTRALRNGGGWVIEGRKLWISRVPEAEFTIVMAVTEPGRGSRGGITAFIVDRGTPGMEVTRAMMVLGGYRTYEVLFDGCRVADAQVLGEVGQGFAPMQHRLTVRRLEMGAWSIGLAERALEMMVGHSKARVTFGQPLAERQTVQWWIADATAKIHAARLMTHEAAWRVERGEDVRTEASMVKVFATEMASEVVDHAVQAFGAMGLVKEMPL